MLIIVIGSFAGCQKTPDVAIVPEEASPFSIYRKEDGQIIKIGDKREDIQNLLGPDEMHVVQFEEDNVERVQYYGNENVMVDYMEDGTVCAISIETDEWKIFNGLSIGMKIDDVKENYPAEHLKKLPQTDDLWVGYDENGNTTKFSLEVPYIVRFAFQDGKKIRLITIQDNKSV